MTHSLKSRQITISIKLVGTSKASFNPFLVEFGQGWTLKDKNQDEAVCLGKRAKIECKTTSTMLHAKLDVKIFAAIYEGNGHLAISVSFDELIS